MAEITITIPEELELKIYDVIRYALPELNDPILSEEQLILLAVSEYIQNLYEAGQARKAESTIERGAVVEAQLTNASRITGPVGKPAKVKEWKRKS